MLTIMGVIALAWCVAGFFYWLGMRYAIKNAAADLGEGGCLVIWFAFCGVVLIGVDYLISHLAWVP